ncbi:PRTase ComF-like protein [Lophiotrema nucula]|uniref:PRTase ComF-like protein n=1 Tax=Lophiotrema nucula TaxID=690887 RepID=A0A6A5YYK6_9PLEO|nr:PRTase ComF-like protein [Lophiotrema nucula]
MSYALHHIDSDDLDQLSFDAKAYSLFKHGDDTHAQRFGRSLAQGFIANAYTVATAKSLVVSVAYHATPTAAHTLRRHFISYLNRYRISQRLDPAVIVDINRTCPYGEDYATQSPNSRRRLLGSSDFHIDTIRVGGSSIVVLDDIRVTGAHEHRIATMFRMLGVVDKAHFVYFAAVRNPGVCPIIECHLNRAAISSIFGLETLIQSGSFVINARLVKFLLGNLHEEFCRLLRRQEDAFVGELLDAAIAEGHGTNVDFEKNFRFLLWEQRIRNDTVGEPT